MSEETESLLRAFIEVSGYNVERMPIKGRHTPVEFKLTKKAPKDTSTDIGLAVARPEGKCINVLTGEEISQEEYDEYEKNEPKSRWIELNYVEGENKVDGVRLEAVAKEIEKAFTPDEAYDFVVALANRLIPEDSGL